MWRKSMTAPAGCVRNRRRVVVSDQVPKPSASDLRPRLCPQLSTRITSSQWGDGFGAASCPMVRLLAEREHRSCSPLTTEVVPTYSRRCGRSV